jgi:hypothetical protein
MMTPQHARGKKAEKDEVPTFYPGLFRGSYHPPPPPPPDRLLLLLLLKLDRELELLEDDEPKLLLVATGAGGAMTAANDATSFAHDPVAPAPPNAPPPPVHRRAGSLDEAGDENGLIVCASLRADVAVRVVGAANLRVHSSNAVVSPKAMR